MCQAIQQPSQEDRDDDDEKNVPVEQAPSSSGFERRKTSIEVGILILSVTYGCTWWLNPDIPVAASYCSNSNSSSIIMNQASSMTTTTTMTDTPCYRPDLIAYKVTSVMCMIYMGVMGLYNWHFSKSVRALSKRSRSRTTTTTTSSSSSSPEARLFGFLEAAEHQNVAILCYQVWDFCVSLTIPEHFDMIFLVHHVLAAFTAYFSLEHGMVPYYAVFFAGCSEFSSIFLVVADMDQLIIPPSSTSTSSSSLSSSSYFEQCILLSKALFAMTFTCYRVVGWWMVSLPLWSDTLHVLRTGSAEKHRPGKSSFLYVFLTLNVLLGLLQLYWFSQIVQAVMQLE